MAPRPATPFPTGDSERSHSETQWHDSTLWTQEEVQTQFYNTSPKPENGEQTTDETESDDSTDISWKPGKYYVHWSMKRIITPDSRVIYPETWGNTAVLRVRKVHPEELEDTVSGANVRWLDADETEPLFAAYSKEWAASKGSGEVRPQFKLPVRGWKFVSTSKPHTGPTYTPPSSSSNSESEQ